MQDSTDLRVYVKTCVKGGSADRDGRIMVIANIASNFVLIHY